MDLTEYFDTKKGFGILATADSKGNVDGAPYSKPHFEDSHTVSFIMADRLSHKNLESNPHAAFIFREEGNFAGRRLFLTKVREEDDPDKINALMKQYHPDWYKAYKDKKKFLVYLRINKVLPLVIKEDDSDSTYVRVKDGSGTEFLCPIDSLVDPKEASEEELSNCLDSAVVGRYSGNFKVVD